MKKIFLGIAIVLFAACESKDEVEQKVNVTLKFTHNWDGTTITNSDFNQLKFTNANGETLSIERLRYVVSNVIVSNDDSQASKNYQLVNVAENSGDEILLESVPVGTYNLKFRFGFSDADNTDGVYQDLNSVSFNVPAMLGGGYHYMQFDGKYLDSNNMEANFNYHTIRAADASDPSNLVLTDTSLLIDLGTVTIRNNAIIEVKMNVAEWFKNPYTWDLNQLNTVLMPNVEAQKLMNANGESVFSLETISQ